MKIITILGARPQFVKASVVSAAFREWNLHNPHGRIEEEIVHTGQHYDDNMSRVFFEELDIPRPNYHLNVGSDSHGGQTGRMLVAVEEVLRENRPDMVIVYGDTNSTLAGALAAVKLHIPIAHIEAGLRSFNRRMPEEINRVLSDRISDLLFCPTATACENLRREGIERGIHQVGDVMYDACLFFGRKALEKSTVLTTLGVREKGYILLTIHRAGNTDDSVRLHSILTAVGEIAKECPVVFPVHPRTRKIIEQAGMGATLHDITVIDPVSYLDMLRLEQSAAAILTDSGGMQKEAYFFEIPCMTLRDETEWVETLEHGWNILVGADREAMLSGFRSIIRSERSPSDTFPFGDGASSEKIVRVIDSFVRERRMTRTG